MGRVTETGTGSPIAGATVSLIPPSFSGIRDFQSAKTDRDGNYTFEAVAAGAYSIRASADGFVDQDYQNDASPESPFLSFDSSTHRQGIDFQLEPEARIHGTVTDESGRPIADLTVSAVSKENAAKNRLAPMASAKSDRAGQFEIRKLQAGVYLVCASGPAGYGDPPHATHWYREKWFENARSSDAATPIHLREHEIRSHVLITTSDEKRYRVIVWPSGPEGAPAPDRFDVRIQHRGGANTRQADGSYVIFDIPPGHYTLISTAWSQIRYLGEGEQSFDVVDSDVTLRIHLGGLGEIAGVAQWLRPPKAVPERLFMIDSEEGAAQGVLVDREGRFHVSRVLPGRYIFKPFEVHPPAIPKSVQCRGQNVSKSSPLIIGDREEVLDCKVTLAEPE